MLDALTLSPHGFILTTRDPPLLTVTTARVLFREREELTSPIEA
jgi:hypothetical protein